MEESVNLTDVNDSSWLRSKCYVTFKMYGMVLDDSLRRCVGESML